MPELEATIAEINALIEAELAKLLPILGEEMTAIVAMELDIDPARLKLVRLNTAPLGPAQYKVPGRSKVPGRDEAVRVGRKRDDNSRQQLQNRLKG